MLHDIALYKFNIHTFTFTYSYIHQTVSGVVG